MDTGVSDLCCVNSRCAAYGRRGGGNLVCRKLYGPERRRFVRCRTCGQEFSERKGTALFGCRLPTDKAVGLLEHLGDGCGVRQTARLTRVTPKTVIRLTRQVGVHAAATHDELARRLTTQEVQLDEKWSFVGKKRSDLRSHRPGRRPAG